MGTTTDLSVDKRGPLEFHGLFQDDFKSGRALRPALLSGTLSEAAQLALSEMGELRRGLLQDYPLDVNRRAIEGAKLPAKLRAQLCAIIFNDLQRSSIMSKSSTAHFSPGKYSQAKLQPFSPQNTAAAASTSARNELRAGPSTGGRNQQERASSFPQATARNSSGISSRPRGSPASAVSRAPFGVLKDPVLAPLGEYTGNMGNLFDPANQGKKRKRAEDGGSAAKSVRETLVPTPKLPVFQPTASSRPAAAKPVQSSQPASAKSNQNFEMQTKVASSAAMSWNPPAQLGHPSTSRVSSAPRFHAAENSRQGATFAPIPTPSPVSRSTNPSSKTETSSAGYYDPFPTDPTRSHVYAGNSSSEADTFENGDEVMAENEESEGGDDAEDEEVPEGNNDRSARDGHDDLQYARWNPFARGEDYVEEKEMEDEVKGQDDVEDEQVVTFEDGNDAEGKQVVVHEGENYAEDEEVMEGKSNAVAEEEAMFEDESYVEDEEEMEGEGNVDNEGEMAYGVENYAGDEEAYEGEYYDETEEESVSEGQSYAQDEDVEMEDDDNAEAEEENHESEENHQSEDENHESEDDNHQSEEKDIDDNRPTTDKLAASGWTEAPGDAHSIVSDISSITHSRRVLRADSGRAYNMWISDGKSIAAYGALLPSKYQLYDDAETPWICPIRSCRNLFRHCQGLGGHFNRKHRAVELNDNRDGTFSEVGHYTGDGRLPALVVSKESPDPNEPPMQPPALPLPAHGKRRADTDTANNQNGLKQSLREPNPAPQVINRGRAAKQEANRKIQIVENWYKVWPHLQNTSITEVPTNGHVQSLLPLELQRSVVFNGKAPAYFERRSRDISALIIQMTGVEAARPCTRCQQGRGPFSGCIVISPGAPLETRKQITSCANCFYKGNQSRCSEFVGRQKETNPESQHDMSAAEDDVEAEQTPARRPGRSSNRPDTESPPKPATENVPRPDQPVPEITRAVVPRSAYDLSMEEWEIAPGRITEPSANGIEKNFLFSGAYLAHGEEVTLSSKIGAHIHVLKPGTMHRFSPAPNRSRVCFVTSGKVLVKTPHGEYPIGQGGLFFVDSDKPCTVQNRLYIDATLSIVVTQSED